MNIHVSTKYIGMSRPPAQQDINEKEDLGQSTGKCPTTGQATGALQSFKTKLDNKTAFTRF
jgi:hypothetical protein